MGMQGLAVMKSGKVLGIALISLAFGVGYAQDRGRKYVPPPETSEIHVTVLRDTNGKPIHNAAVVMHPLKNGKDEGAMELKTDEDGKAALDIIPMGDVLRLQIIAPGFQTFGEDYPVDAASKEITIRMRRPGQQYSIYKANGTGGEQKDQSKVENKDTKSGNAQPPPDSSSTQTGPPQ